jgi:hypothetical protein
LSVARKLAIPAAGIVAAAIGQGAGTAAAATVPHHSDAATVTQPASRRARAIDILQQRPMGMRPDTASNSAVNNGAFIHFYLAGAKSHVSYVEAYACTDQSTSLPREHLEIQKPNGKAYKNSTQRGLARSECTPSLSGFPDVNDAGYWHAILWSHLANGDYANVVSTYVHVLT